MKSLLSIVLLAMSPVLFAQQNVARTTSVYNEEGKLQMLIAYNPACTCRTYTEFYPDGKIYAKRTFRVVEKGEYIDGEDITYYNDGSIKHYKVWQHTVPEGRAYTNYENGKLEHEELYANKFKTGTWKYYDKKGELLREHVHEPGKNAWNSKKDHVTVRYYAAGKLLYTEVFAGGKKIKSDRKDSATVVPAVGTALLDGKKLFSLKCAACHAFDKDGFGPSLKNVTRNRSNDWLFLMIRNGMQLVNDGDKEAIALYNKWRKMKHPSMEKLSNKQIQAIIDFLKTAK